MIYNESDFNQMWDTKSLNELGNFSRGISKHRPRNDEILFENGIYPFVQTGEIKEAKLFIDSHTQEYGEFGLKQSRLWDSGTLCITIAANIAETAILKYEMCFPDSIVGFTAFPDISSEIFMHYIFEYIRSSIQKSASGSIQDNINIEYLSNLKFKVPKKYIQDEIISILYSIDKKFQNNKKIIAELETMAKTIYDYWFTQFDFPDENGKPYKSSGGEMIYNEVLKRDIPKGWEVAPILNVVSWNGGSQPPKKEHIYNKKDGYIRFIQNRDYSQNRHITYIPIAKKNKVCNKYDIMIDKYGDAGKTRFGIAGAYNVALSKIDIKKENFQEYIRRFLESSAIKQYLESSCKASTRASLNEDTLSFINIVVPSDKLVGKFETMNKKFLDEILICKEENQQLTELRDWLLPMLMNGQARVEE